MAAVVGRAIARGFVALARMAARSGADVGLNLVIVDIVLSVCRVMCVSGRG